MNSNLLFPLMLLKMRSCQRGDIYLYLASNWSGLWLCIFSHLFKSQKLQITGFDLGCCHVSVLHRYFSPPIRDRICFVTQKVTVTKRSPLPYTLYLCIYPCLFLLHFSSIPSTQLLPGLLLSCISFPPTLPSLHCPVDRLFLSLTIISKWPFMQQ